MVALVRAGIMILISPARPGELVEDVEWETLLFFIGLFILVGALVEVGALEQLAQFMANATDLAGGADTDGGAHRLGSGLGDRRQHPVRDGHDAGGRVFDRPNPALGQTVRCGGRWLWARTSAANATLVGASANVVVVGIAARNGLHISFWTWMKYGVPTAAMSIAIPSQYVLLRYVNRIAFARPSGSWSVPLLTADHCAHQLIV